MSWKGSALIPLGQSSTALEDPIYSIVQPGILINCVLGVAYDLGSPLRLAKDPIEIVTCSRDT